MNTANPDDVVTLPPTSAPIEADMPTGAIVRRAQRAAATRAGGIPAQFAHAWAWAADWVSKNGVTLPPDTNDYRSLRNWFSYQVNAYNKGTLSERSKALLTQYSIDLSLYRAPNTGRGQLADDAAMILRMEELYAISGSYDMPAEAGDDLIQWQARLLECFRTRGSSARLRAIEARLPGLRIGMWLRPDETPIPAQQLDWWAQAEQFRVATASCQAYAGVVDPRTPAPLVVWAFDQRRAFDEGRLSQRQKGELRALGVLPNQDSVRNRERSAALAKARAAFAASMGATPTQSRDRDLRSFAGVCLLMRMVQRNAPARDFYPMFGLDPVQLARINTALELLMVPVVALATPHRLGQLRSLYAKHRSDFDVATNVQDLPEGVFGTAAAEQALRRLANLAFEIRDQIRELGLQQDLSPAARPAPSPSARVQPVRSQSGLLASAFAFLRPAASASPAALAH